MREVKMKQTFGYGDELTIYVTVDPRSLSRRTSLYFDLGSLAGLLGLEEQET